MDQAVSFICGGTLAIVAVAACVLHAMVVRHDRSVARRARAVAAARVLAPQAGPLIIRKIDDPLHDWAQSVKENPLVRLVAVHDRTGQIRAVETDRPELAKRAVRSDQVMDGLYEPATWHVTTEAGQAYWGAMVPVFFEDREQPVGQLTLAFQTDGKLPATSPWWVFYVPVVLATVIGWWLANNLVTHRVFEPFRRLCNQAGRADGNLPVDRKDQLGHLARTFLKLHEQIDHWRGEAKDLEVKLERRLESQSRKHMIELDKAGRVAEVDSLTGLKNRRFVDSYLDPMIDEHRRQDEDLSLIMLDVDHFKGFNDALGHPAGDELLVFIGQLLTKSIRDEDTAIRLGGDEFAVILPRSQPQEAEAIAKRLAALFGQFVKTLPPIDSPPSLSAGVADITTTHATSASKLLRFADNALYEAKRTGKNRVVVAPPRHPGQEQHDTSSQTA